MSPNPLETLLIGVIISCAYVSAYPAVHNVHMQKRQSYGRSNQLVPTQDHYYGQPSYNNYNYNYDQDVAGARRNYYNNNGYQQQNYYDYPQRQYYGGRDRDPMHGAYDGPIQREITVRNGQMRQKEYQKRTGQEGRDTYDPFYFYVNPVAAAGGPPVVVPGPGGPPVGDASPSPTAPNPTTVTAALSAAGSSREQQPQHIGGPPRNRRNSLNAPPRDPYFDNEISGDKYEILTSKPSYPRLQNSYPPPPSYASSRYSSTGSSISGYNHPPPGNPNQFLNYEQIVGAQPPRYANGSPPRGPNQPWSIQIGTQLKVNDDGKGPNSGSRYYVRDERNTRSRRPLYRK